MLVENYLQHADHYSRRLAEVSSKTSDLSRSNENSKILNNSEITNNDKSKVEN